ncbi:MAG: hypothetical protein AB7F86_19180 [Bdellovibrionales bacterium]
MSESVFIRAMHPKTEISPSLAAVEKILKAGWGGQLKIHGHRAQIHLCADASKETVVYNRQGQPHKLKFPDTMELELRRLLTFKEGWTVLDAEWLKPEGRLYLFDVLKLDDQLLRRLSYPERHKLLPRSYISPQIKTLPILTNSERCMAVLAGDEPHVEGLVFKSLSTKGFEDTSIVRCRKRR